MTPRQWSSSKDARELLRYAAPRVPRQLLVLASVACARTAIPYLNDETRGPALQCLHVTEAWVWGRASLEEIRAAAAAAYDAAAAAADADDANAAYAAYAAADAAYAAASAASAAYAAAYATASSAASAAYAADAAAAATAAATAATYAAAAANAAAAATAAAAAAKRAGLEVDFAAIVRAAIPYEHIEEDTP